MSPFLFMSAGSLLAGIVATAIPAAAQQATFTCPVASPPDRCGNPEFRSCLIDVPDSSGVLVEQRNFCIHVPRQPAADEMSVIYGFHGGGGDARVAVSWMADQTEQGAVLVAPSALQSGENCNTVWRSFGDEWFDEWAEIDQSNDPCASPPPGIVVTRDNDADLDFMQALMNEIEVQLEPAHHFAWGFSSGASMAYQLMITSPLSERFSGFGMIGAAMNEAKLDAAAGGSGVDWSAQTETAHPVLVSQGTADRVFFPTELIVARTEELIAAAAAAVPPKAGPCLDASTAPSAENVLRCWRENPMLRGAGQHYYEDQGMRTLDFLLARNRPARRALEGLYPHVGHGRDSALNEEDQTVTVRREWPATQRSGSQPVVMLNVIGAQHVIPGARGSYPPCASAACDVDAFREILQFWRANAGLQTRWR